MILNAGVTPNDPLGAVLAMVAVVIVGIALFVANHNLKDRF